MNCLRLWLDYPIHKAIKFLDRAGVSLRSHVLVVGSVAFLVCWRSRKREEPQP